MDKKILCGLTSDEIFELIEPFGFTKSHSLKITNFIYKKGISDFSLYPDIPKKLKEHLSDFYDSGLTLPVSSQISADKSVKYLFSTPEGNYFETVYIPDGKRNTVCVSSQSGCRMGCSFCQTGKYGFKADLTTGEILNQVISLPHFKSVTHVVFMGMGEPMDNIVNVMKACDILASEWGMAISCRNITVSSVGVLPGIRKLLENSDCNLTLSLFSPFPEERVKAIPLEKKYPALNIIEELGSYHMKKGRRVSIAYLMINEVNDSDEHLERLIALLSGSSLRVNLLPYHSTAKDNFDSSSKERMQYFKHRLVTAGISASVRKSRGADISAACGLLASGLKRVD